MLAFLIFPLYAGSINAGDLETQPWQPRVTLIIEIKRAGDLILRDAVEFSPSQVFTRPVELTNHQPALLRCEARIVASQAVRTLCQILSGNAQPGFSKTRWVESRVGKSDSMYFRDLNGAELTVNVTPTRVSYEQPRAI